MDTRFSISDDRRELSINNVEESVLGTYEVVATIETKTARDSVIIAIPGICKHIVFFKKKTRHFVEHMTVYPQT